MDEKIISAILVYAEAGVICALYVALVAARDKIRQLEKRLQDCPPPPNQERRREKIIPNIKSAESMVTNNTKPSTWEKSFFKALKIGSNIRKWTANSIIAVARPARMPRIACAIPRIIKRRIQRVNQNGAAPLRPCP